jgi:hypothetical protein
MRPCSACVSRGLTCVVSQLDERCEQCYRNQRSCELAQPWDEFNRVLKKKKELDKQILAAEAKAIRLRKQRRLLQKKIKSLGNREAQNILDLEADEALDEALTDLPVLEPTQASTPRPQSPSGFSQVSFGSLDRTSPVPTGSS